MGSTTPQNMRAIVSSRYLITRLINFFLNQRLGGSEIVQNIPRPTIGPDELLVRPTAVALNPIDAKNLDAFSPAGSIIGCDFAGIVQEVGVSASSKWQVGDRVAGVVHGGMYADTGAFAEVIKVVGDQIWRIPGSVTDAAASTYGVSAVTAMLSVNHRAGLAWPASTKSTGKDQRGAVFIYGGSTIAGLFTIQLAKAAGRTVAVTCSPRSFELVKRYGADFAFDYRSSDVVDQIQKAIPTAALAIDCFSEGSSALISGSALRANGGTVYTLLPTSAKVPGVTYEQVMSYTLMGKAFQLFPPIGPKYKASSTDREALVQFYEILPSLIENGILIGPPLMELHGGFEGIRTGLDKLRAKEVSGQKIVVHFD